MTEQELGGNIALVDFNLDDQEMIIIKKIIGNYAKKIKGLVEYQELKLEMRAHKKSGDSAPKYEIKVHLTFDKDQANTQVEGLNPFVLVDDVMRKILKETEHKIKKW